MISRAEPGYPAGGDPLAVFVAESPYVRLPVSPDDGVKAILLVQQKMQREGLSLQEDGALRTLRDAPARVVWDLFTLGTTPGIPTALWNETRAQLAAGGRAGARAQWLGKSIDPASSEGLQVRGVLAANALASTGPGDRAALGEALARFVGCWASLLARPDWLRKFARSRCATWSHAGARVELDLADETGLPERLEREAFGFIERATAHDEELKRRWRCEWGRERVAIEVLLKVSRAGVALPGGVPRGLGPCGLADLGRLDDFVSALRPLAEKGKRAFPVGAVREGLAVLDHAAPETVGLAASALRLIYSPLFGSAAAALWSGNGHEAEARLADCEERGTAAPWFASLEERARAEATLRLEIGLQCFREDLANDQVPVAVVLDAAKPLLAQARPLDLAQEMREAVEKKVAGRTIACIEAAGVPKPGEMRRVVAISTGARALLKDSGGGDIVAQAIAQLRMRRAADIWNRTKGHPHERDRLRVLQDLFQAAEIAPHNPEIAQSIVAVVVQLQEQVAPVDGQGWLEKADRVLAACEERAGGHPGLRAARGLLNEFIHPDQVISENWDAINIALGKPPASTNEGGQ